MIVPRGVSPSNNVGRRPALIALPFVLLCLFAIPTTSLATLTISFDQNGVLTVSSDASDSIQISSAASGYLLVNGVPPEGLAILVSDITKVIVNGGPGVNVIDLGGVTRAAFTILSDNNVIIHGGEGNDTITGSEFGDYMYGEGGADTQHGGDGDDLQEGGAGNDWQHGGSGNDTQLGGDGNERQYGGSGMDTQFGEGGNDTQYGGEGDDEQHGGAGSDTQYGEAGNDTQYGGDGNDTQWGEDGDDTQDGGEGRDRQFGQAGDDTQFGRDGNDEQWGDVGSDKQWGEDGDDTQWGNDGNDEQHGGEGDDIQCGGEGDDSYYIMPGGDDDDTVIDPAGNDTLFFSEATFGIRLDLDLQNVDQDIGGLRNTVRLEGQIENFIGSPFDDFLFIGPLDVPRYVNGWPHELGDTLMFADVGVDVTYDDSTITAEGFAVVTYEEFEFLGFGGVGTVEPMADVPHGFVLSQNHPNPFRTETMVRFAVHEPCRVILKVHNLQGQELQTVLDAPYAPGIYPARLTAANLPSGCYLYTIEVGGVRSARKMVIVQ